MGIWVRSDYQDILTETDNVFLKYVTDDDYKDIVYKDERSSIFNFIKKKKEKKVVKNYIVVNTKYNYDFWIGRYSTLEKASKVLNMIQERIIKQQTLGQNNPFGGLTHSTQETLVFQMPLDDEVEV